MRTVTVVTVYTQLLAPGMQPASYHTETAQC